MFLKIKINDPIIFIKRILDKQFYFGDFFKEAQIYFSYFFHMKNFMEIKIYGIFFSTEL